MEREDAMMLGEVLRSEGIESHGHLTLQEDAPEFGKSYSLHLQTKNRTINPGLMGILNSHGLSLTYVGEADVTAFNAEWLVERA